MESSMLPALGEILLWGLIATIAMTIILFGSQGLGYSRLSLPFLMGTFFTANRHRAIFVGFSMYVVGGLVFASFYYFVFLSLEFSSWWLGALLGLFHGLFLVAVGLPVLPYLHPRMASEYDGPSAIRRLEPPGFLGLNYGIRTPLTTMLGQLVYGLILGAFIDIGPY